MAERRVGLIMNGVTGRMGTNQHLVRSVAAIRADGRVMNDLYIARVRKPGEVADKRDNVAIETRVPAERLYAGESACPLLRPVN